MSYRKIPYIHPLAHMMTDEQIRKAEIRLSYQAIEEQVKDMTRESEIAKPLTLEERIFAHKETPRGNGFARELNLCN